MIYDALVVGGGPAGCATAIYAGRAGLRVALVERATHPRPKTCGEGLMPAGVEVLRELGLLERADSLGRRFRGVRYVTSEGRSALGLFPAGKDGLASRREDLDHLLWTKAASTPGVEAFAGREAAGVETRLTAVCDGGRSKTAETLGSARVQPRRRRFGLAARFDGVPEGDGLVEVFLGERCELYLTPLPDGRATVAALFESEAMTDAPERLYDSKIELCAFLRRRLGQASRATPVRGLGPLGGRASRVYGADWLLVGDAAEALDPIIGEGVAAALQTGRLAGRALARAAAGDRDAFRRYAREREGLLRCRRWLAGGVLSAAARPRAAEAVVAGLARLPELFNATLSLF